MLSSKKITIIYIMKNYMRTEYVKVCPGNVVQLEMHIFQQNGEELWFQSEHLTEICTLLSDVMCRRVSNRLEQKKRSRKHRCNQPEEKQNTKDTFTEPQVLSGQTLRMSYCFRKMQQNNHVMVCRTNKNTECTGFFGNKVFEEKLVVFVYHLEGFNKIQSEDVLAEPLESRPATIANLVVDQSSSQPTVPLQSSGAVVADIQTQPGTSAYFPDTDSSTKAPAKVDLLKNFARKPKRVRKLHKQPKNIDASMADFVMKKSKRGGGQATALSDDENFDLRHNDTKENNSQVTRKRVKPMQKCITDGAYEEIPYSLNHNPVPVDNDVDGESQNDKGTVSLEEEGSQKILLVSLSRVDDNKTLQSPASCHNGNNIQQNVQCSQKLTVKSKRANCGLEEHEDLNCDKDLTVLQTNSIRDRTLRKTQELLHNFSFSDIDSSDKNEACDHSIHSSISKESTNLSETPTGSPQQLLPMISHSEEGSFNSSTSEGGSGEDLFSDLSDAEITESVDKRTISVNRSISDHVSPVRPSPEPVNDMPQYSTVSSYEDDLSGDSDGACPSPHFLSLRSSKQEIPVNEDLPVVSLKKVDPTNGIIASTHTTCLDENSNEGKKCKIRLKMSSEKSSLRLPTESEPFSGDVLSKGNDETDSEASRKRKYTRDDDYIGKMSPMAKRPIRNRTKDLEKVLEELDDEEFGGQQFSGRSDDMGTKVDGYKSTVNAEDTHESSQRVVQELTQRTARLVYHFDSESSGVEEEDPEFMPSKKASRGKRSRSSQKLRQIKTARKAVGNPKRVKGLATETNQESSYKKTMGDEISLTEATTAEDNQHGKASQQHKLDVKRTFASRQAPRLRLSKSNRIETTSQTQKAKAASDKQEPLLTKSAQQEPSDLSVKSIKLEKPDPSEIGCFLRRSRRSIIVETPSEVIDLEVEDLFNDCIIQEELSQVVIKIEDTVADAIEEELRGVQEVGDLTNDQLSYLVSRNERYLRNIFQGKSHCRRHEDYKRGGPKRLNLKWQIPLGLYKEPQLEHVLWELHAIFCKRHTKYLDYVLKVMFPEMLIKIYMEVKKVDHNRAEDDMEAPLSASDTDSDSDGL